MVWLSVFPASFRRRLVTGNLLPLEEKLLSVRWGAVAGFLAVFVISVVLIWFYSQPYWLPGRATKVFPALTSWNGWKQATSVDISWAARRGPQFYVFAIGMTCVSLLGGFANLVASETIFLDQHMVAWRLLLRNLYFCSAMVFAVCGVVMAWCSCDPNHGRIQRIHEATSSICLAALWTCSALYEVLLCQQSMHRRRAIFTILLPLPWLLIWVFNNPVLFRGRTRQSWAEWIFIVCLFRHAFKLKAYSRPTLFSEPSRDVAVKVV